MSKILELTKNIEKTYQEELQRAIEKRASYHRERYKSDEAGNRRRAEKIEKSNDIELGR